MRSAQRVKNGDPNPGMIACLVINGVETFLYGRQTELKDIKRCQKKTISGEISLIGHKAE
jgi:hypothetical protein